MSSEIFKVLCNGLSKQVEELPTLSRILVQYLHFDQHVTIQGYLDNPLDYSNVVDYVKECDKILANLKANLNRASDRMKGDANAKWKDRVVEVGD